MSKIKNRRRHKRRKIFTKEYDDDEEDDYDSGVKSELRNLGFCVDDDDDGEDNEAEEDEGGKNRSLWGYDLETKISCHRFLQDFDRIIDRIEGKCFNAGYFHERGFKKPIYFENTNDLGLAMPCSSDFNVADVKRLVGANRTIDVVDVKTQRGFQMTMREFVDYYYQNPDRRDRLLNVLSLEFSKTKLADYVKAPSAVKDLDWVELAWPRELRDQQTDATNALNSMKYPKVQNYCLMSVARCYTDFHVDFGGTSVWYHILRGEKIFWLVPPTEQNCQRFQKWTLSGRQHKTFFGDLVDVCVRVHLKSGDTFMIPSGWFHAVYTPIDSLVFGGNFLHSFAIPMQLSVFEIERNTHVPLKFRYPFFLEMQWFVLERYYRQLTGSGRFLKNNSSTSTTDIDTEKSIIDNLRFDRATLLTECELEGLHVLVNWLQSLPGGRKRRVPDLIDRPEMLLDNFQRLLPQLNSITRLPISALYTILSFGGGGDRQELKQLPTTTTIIASASKIIVSSSPERKKKKKDAKEVIQQLPHSSSSSSSSFPLETNSPKNDPAMIKEQEEEEDSGKEHMQLLSVPHHYSSSSSWAGNLASSAEPTTSSTAVRTCHHNQSQNHHQQQQQLMAAVKVQKEQEEEEDGEKIAPSSTTGSGATTIIGEWSSVVGNVASTTSNTGGPIVPAYMVPAVGAECTVESEAM